MSIWVYEGEIRNKGTISSVINSERCLFCNEVLRVLKHESDSAQIYESEHKQEILHVRTCDICGWWWATKTDYRAMTNIGKYKAIDPAEYIDNRLWGASAVLKSLDLTDISTPISEVRNELIRNYKKAKGEIQYTLFEETVATVFRDLGYHAVATGRSGDDGIDVVLTGKNNETIGVQVKRYKDKNRIGVAQIRDFMGALYDKGWLKGIFVTTSDFQSGAQPLTERLAARGTRIELVNANRFYEELKLAQRNRYRSLSDADAPYLSTTFTLLRSDQYRRDPDPQTIL
jgi:restriction system protein